MILGGGPNQVCICACAVSCVTSFLSLGKRSEISPSNSAASEKVSFESVLTLHRLVPPLLE